MSEKHDFNKDAVFWAMILLAVCAMFISANNIYIIQVLKTITVELIPAYIITIRYFIRGAIRIMVGTIGQW